MERAGGCVRQASLSGLPRSVPNGPPVSPRPPGFGWRARRRPSRLRAGTQRPRAPRPSGVRFRFVQQQQQQQGLVARWRLGKPLAAAWMGVGWSPLPRLRARGCARLRVRCAVQPRARGFRFPPIPPPELHSWDSGVAAAQAIGPARRSRGSPDPETRPCLARAPLSGRKHQRVCAPDPPTGRTLLRSFGGSSGLVGGGRTDSRGACLVRSGLRASGRGQRRRGAAGRGRLPPPDPASAFPSPPWAVVAGRYSGDGPGGTTRVALAF